MKAIKSLAAGNGAMTRAFALSALLAVGGCASVPQETPITASVPVPVAQAQFALEDLIRSQAPSIQVESQSNNMMQVRADCMSLASMDAMKCSMIMMGIGNAGWSGPFHVQHYRFIEQDGRTLVRGHWNWCAVNAAGKENCAPINPAGPNNYLRALEKQFQLKIVINGVEAQ